jgi:hypothetical protein
MKKKVLKSFLVLIFMVSVMLPYSMVFAFTNGVQTTAGILQGKTADQFTNSTSLASATDNNISTSANVGASTGQMKYILSTAQNITKIYLNSGTGLSVVLQNSAGTTMRSWNPVQGFTDFSSDNLTDIKNVIIYNYSASSVALNEIDFYATIDTTPPANVSGLTETHSDVSASLNWINPADSDFNGVKIYQAGSLLTTLPKTDSSYTITDLSPSTSYTFKVATLDNLNNESSGQTVNVTTGATPDIVAPSVPVGLSAVAADQQVSLSWTVNSDDTTKYFVYKDGVQIATVSHPTNTYVAGTLVNGTSYDFSISAVDAANNESVKTSVVSATPVAAMAVPTVPTNVQIVTRNSALLISWNAVLSATGYNIYIDGVKANSSPVTSTTYGASSLTNGTSYLIEVAAVNAIGESNKSVAQNGTPSDQALPFISFNYQLADVATGVSSWFGSYWLILAFSIAVPLSFVVAHRIKGLFFG